MNCRSEKVAIFEFWKPRSRLFQQPVRSDMKAKAFELLTFSVALGLAANVFAQEKPEAVPHDTGSDLLWKKLETRVEEIAARLDGVMGVAILDLTDGRILL